MDNFKNLEIDEDALGDAITHDEAQRIAEFAANSLAQSTKKSYKYSWQLFVSYCEERKVDPLHAGPKMVAGYIVARRENGIAPSTIHKNIQGISWMRKRRDASDPTDAALVGRVLQGVRQAADPNEGYGKAMPALTTHVRSMVEALPLDSLSEGASRRDKEKYLRALRDRAIILTGYFGALRRSEIQNISVKSITENAEGIKVYLPEAKTGARTVPINTRDNEEHALHPVAALNEWLEVAGIASGPVFRSVQWARIAPDDEATPASRGVVHRAVKNAAEAAGFDRETFSPHSLRRGHITQGALNGVSLRVLMKQAGHANPATTAAYVGRALKMKQSSSGDL
jgi:integrase